LEAAREDSPTVADEEAPEDAERDEDPRPFDPGLTTGYLRRGSRDHDLPVEIGAAPFDPGPGTGYDERRARRDAKRRQREEGQRLQRQAQLELEHEERERVEASLSAWKLRVPQLRSSWDDLGHSFNRSVADLASLRLRGGDGLGNLPAAGMPWFMTVFGRDTIITCLQTLMFGPELARSALQVLADLQAGGDDPEIDAEPGKIVHEIRRGKAAQNWFDAYYGSLDATPLYLILLSEVWRWTDDAALVRHFKDPALKALAWIDVYGDRDGDGFVEYQKRSERGLDNQSWKDSWDSQRFANGKLAEPPIAPVEAQGYVYDAKRRMAELAREVWGGL